MFRCKIITSLFFFFLMQNPLEAQMHLPDTTFHPDSIRTIISFLASDQLKGRFTGSNEADSAAKFIAVEFQRAGLSPVASMDGYFSEFRFIDREHKDTKGLNIIGAIEGKSKKEELIIFCAHYDHIGTLSTNPFPGFPVNVKKDPWDTIYNGANDNASGTAALIMLARYFKSSQINERTILFIAFSGEEQGTIGSGEFSTRFDPTDVVAVINIEMIGRGLFNKNDNPFITGGQFSNLREILNRRLKDQEIGPGGRKIAFKKDPYADENLFSRSDNYPFARKGVPAHTLMLTKPTDVYYHSVKDETNTLNFQNMSLIIKAIAISTEGLVSGADTPTRITIPKK